MDPRRSPLIGVVNCFLIDAASALRILCEALRILSRKLWPVLYFVLLFLSLDTLIFLFTILPFPVPLDSDGKPTLLAEILQLLYYIVSQISWALDFFKVMVMTFTTTAIYSGGDQSLTTPGDLCGRMRREWRGPVLTQLCVIVLRGGYWSLVDQFSGGLYPITDRPAAVFVFAALNLVVSLCGDVLYYYLDVAWASSYAASVVDDRRGLPAVTLAGEVTRGRKLRGVFIAIFCQILSGAVGLADPVFTDDLPDARDMIIPLVIHTFVMNALTLLYMLKLAAFTVFYHECKESRHGEEESLQYTILR